MKPEEGAAKTKAGPAAAESRRYALLARGAALLILALAAAALFLGR